MGCLSVKLQLVGVVIPKLIVTLPAANFVFYSNCFPLKELFLILSLSLQNFSSFEYPIADECIIETKCTVGS